jgi:hypothetical protein
MRAFAESIWSAIVGKETHWLVGPADGKSYIAWTHTEPTGYTFVASMTGDLPTIGSGLVAGEVVFDEAGCQIYKEP